MKFIDLSPIKCKTYLFSWNGGEIVEIHNAISIYEKYQDTNLFDGQFDDDFDTSIPEILSGLGINDYQVYDNMRVERIK